MDVYILVMGSDTSKLLPASSLAAVTTFGGAVVKSCGDCKGTTRLTVGEPTTGVFQAQLLNAAELKPAETHVLSFPDEVASKAWIDNQAAQLRGKTVFHIGAPPP